MASDESVFDRLRKGAKSAGHGARKAIMTADDALRELDESIESMDESMSQGPQFGMAEDRDDDDRRDPMDDII